MARTSRFGADPYDVAMKAYERRALGYSVIAVISIIATFAVTSLLDERAGAYAPMLDQIRFALGVGLLAASAVSCTLSLWSASRRVYFAKWPDRFHGK